VATHFRFKRRTLARYREEVEEKDGVFTFSGSVLDLQDPPPLARFVCPPSIARKKENASCGFSRFNMPCARRSCSPARKRSRISNRGKASDSEIADDNPGDSDNGDLDSENSEDATDEVSESDDVERADNTDPAPSSRPIPRSRRAANTFVPGNKLLKLKGQPIAPDPLYDAVEKLGGFSTVVNQKRWQQVRKTLQLPQLSSSGAQLRKAYVRTCCFVFPFWCRCEVGFFIKAHPSVHVRRYELYFGYPEPPKLLTRAVGNGDLRAGQKLRFHIDGRLNDGHTIDVVGTLMATGHIVNDISGPRYDTVTAWCDSVCAPKAPEHPFGWKFVTDVASGKSLVEIARNFRAESNAPTKPTTTPTAQASSTTTQIETVSLMDSSDSETDDADDADDSETDDSDDPDARVPPRVPGIGCSQKELIFRVKRLCEAIPETVTLLRTPTPLKRSIFTLLMQRAELRHGREQWLDRRVVVSIARAIEAHIDTVCKNEKPPWRKKALSNIRGWLPSHMRWSRR